MFAIDPDQHWKPQAAKIIEEFNNLAGLELPQNDKLMIVANAGRAFHQLLHLAVNEKENQAMQSAWSEGIKFAILEMAKHDVAFINGKMVGVVAKLIVLAARQVKATAPGISTEALRLRAVMEECIELLEDVQAGADAMQTTDEVLAKMVAVLEEMPKE